MQDAVSSIVNKYDLSGKYLDQEAMNKLNEYFKSGIDRISIAEVINSNVSDIVKEASAKLYEEQPELLRPGGNSYTTRRYAACLRDIEYYLRYSSYAIMAGNVDIIGERVLDGLKDTYNSLEVPIGPTVRSVQILQEVIAKKTKTIDQVSMTSEPFQYIINSLSDQNI